MTQEGQFAERPLLKPGQEWLQGQDWELVQHRGSEGRIERFRITGGWLYRVFSKNPSGIDSMAITFVPESSGAPLYVP